MTAHLTDEQGQVLVKLARANIAAELGFKAPWPEHDDFLKHPGASFVTLHLDGQLRGCIGTLVPYRELCDDVAENALSAAFHDPRFRPLSAAEYPEIELSVSVLSPPQPVEFDGTEAGAIAALQPGSDGVVLYAGRHRATYLPQVWESLPDPQEFLRSLKRKARLDDHFWSSEVRLERYSVDEWSESHS